MSKRVQLPPPEHDVISGKSDGDDPWVIFPNGKRRRKVTSVETSTIQSSNLCSGRSQTLVVHRIRGYRWQMEESQNETSRIKSDSNDQIQNVYFDEADKGLFGSQSKSSCLSSGEENSAFENAVPMTCLGEKNESRTATDFAIDRAHTVLLSDFNISKLGEYVYVTEFLIPCPLLSEIDCESIFCFDDESVDQSASGLEEMLAAMSLRSATKSLPLDAQNLLSARVLFEVLSNLTYHTIPITSKHCFGENRPAYDEAMRTFYMEMMDILRLLWEGSSCLESICEVLAFFRRISQESASSDSEQECSLMVRTCARLLDEALYCLTDTEKGTPITKGSIVRVYDAVLHRAFLTSNTLIRDVDSACGQSRAKLRSYFVCLFDPQYDSFLCKSDCVLGVAPAIDSKPDGGNLPNVEDSNEDSRLVENWKSNHEMIEVENSKDIVDMRHYLSVCKGFPQHGVRGGIKFWKKCCFKEAKHTQKLRLHSKYGKFAEMVLRQNSKLSSEDFDSLMRKVWLIPEVSSCDIELKTRKDLRKLNVFARMLCINRRACLDRKSKARHTAQSCTLCSLSISLTNLEATGYGIQCGSCKSGFCMSCIRSSSFETAPRMFSSFDWVCSRCYKDSEECEKCQESGLLIVCDGCNKDYCFPCAELKEDSVPSGEWFCKPCKEKSELLGRRVNVLCSDGEKYHGIVSSWDRRLEEFKITLDCGEVLHSPLTEQSWDVEVIDDPRKTRS